MSPVSYHCRPHNRVVKALITGQDLYGTRFSTLLELQPKPASLDTTADVLLGSDWLRDCAIHAIQNRPDTAPAAISQPLASPAEDLSADVFLYITFFLSSSFLLFSLSYAMQTTDKFVI
ncbi:hypothetical protein C8J56DRAFT_1047978 [Mycena floridula]|nr:hypothetical protein C8J56DRAFT_1047978 [Mycena floridula]